MTFLESRTVTDSETDPYGKRYERSSESLTASRMGVPESSTPTVLDLNGGARDAYPAWSAERDIPLSKEEIEDIFLDLTQKFGFQKDSMRNMVGTSCSGAKLISLIAPLPLSIY